MATLERRLALRRSHVDGEGGGDSSESSGKHAEHAASLCVPVRQVEQALARRTLVSRALAAGGGFVGNSSDAICSALISRRSCSRQDLPYQNQ